MFDELSLLVGELIFKIFLRKIDLYVVDLLNLDLNSFVIIRVN